MIFIHPILTLIVSFLLFIVVCAWQKALEKRVKWQIVTLAINTALGLFVFISFTYFFQENRVLEIIYFVFAASNVLLFTVLLLLFIYKIVIIQNEHQIITKAMKESRWNAYYIVDRKERIKDISSSLLKELNLAKSDVIGKNLFVVFNKSIRFSKLNNIEINNRNLEIYYLEFKKRIAKNKAEEEEIVFLNYNGEEMVLHVENSPIYRFNRYQGRILIGEKRTDFDLLKVEKENQENQNTLKDFTARFLATYEISEEGLFSIDLETKVIWMSDKLVKTLGLISNEIKINDFQRLIEASDLNKHLETISGLTVNSALYQSTYRFNVKGTYLWLKEKGKRIFSENGTTIIGTINPIATKHFMASNIDILDSLKDINEMFVLANKRLRENKLFEMALIKLSNIPSINELYSREVGNMFIADYIRRLKEMLVSDTGGIFRISGLEFVVVITDPRKMEFLRKGKISQSDFLNISLNYGSINEVIEVYSGITSSKISFNSEEEMLKASKQALKIALNHEYLNNICYFEELQNV